MENEFQQGVLGRTGLSVGRLGVAASYGAPAEAFEKAFEKGCNYFSFGSGRRRSGMRRAIRNLTGRGKRDGLVVSIHTYARFGLLATHFFRQTLRSMNIEWADVLVLGWHNRPPSPRLIDHALELKHRGLVRYIGVSGHRRSLFPEMAKQDVFDLFHIRYNAAHRGAETEAFPGLALDNRPGIVTYTATRWGHLLEAKNMPPGEAPLTAPDCYRFVLSNPAVDVCLCGPADRGQMSEALSALDRGPLTDQEAKRVRRIGDHVHDGAGGFFKF